MAFEFDAGPRGGGNRYLKWKVQGGETYGPETFVTGYGDSAAEYAPLKNGGVVMDIDTLRTGWNSFGAREWVWNDSVSRFAPKPDDANDDWKKGFSVVLEDDDGSVVWEQEGASAFGALERLAPELRKRDGDKLPRVRLKNVERLPKQKMAIPILEIVEWVDRSTAAPSGTSTDDGGF